MLRQPGPWLAGALAAASAEASRLLAFADGGLSLFWPVAGIGLAMLYRWGWQGLLALYSGLLMWALNAYPQQLWAAPWVALASTIGPLAVWRLTSQHWQGQRSPFNHIARVSRFLQAELLVGAPLAALLGTATLLWVDPGARVGTLSLTSSVLSYVLVYWVIEACGALLVTPVAWDLLVGLQHLPWRKRLQTAWVALKANPVVMLAIPALAALMASSFAFSEAANARAFSYLLLPLLVMVANRCGPRATHLHLAACGLLVTAMSAFAMQRLRPGAEDALVELLLLVLFMLVSAGVVLLLVALSAERRQALQRLESQAFTDPLTGLANEAGLLRVYEQWLQGGAPALGVVRLRLANSQAIEQLQGPTHLTAQEMAAAACLQRLQPGWQWARTAPGRLMGLTLAEQITPDSLGGLLLALSDTAPAPATDSPTNAVRPLWQAAAALVEATAQQLPFSVLLSRLREATAQSQTDARPVLLTVHAGDSQRLRTHAEATERVRDAITQGRLTLWAQPIGQAPWGQTADRGLRCEILVRLLDEQGQIWLPGDFLPAAMQGGLMQLLDRAVIDQTLAWFATHPQTLARVDYCSLNLSGPTMGNPGIASWIAAAFQRHGVPPRHFTFEITESQAISQPRQAADTLQQLRALGSRVAIDDFGTGHATFDYLKRFPVDIIKIDAAFVKELDTQPLDRVIVRSMVEVARLLNVKTVAEHVDSPEILRWTQELGIDDVQGYLLGKPQPLAQLLG